MSHGDGGKGSGRRKEDASKVRDNWDLIFGKGKTTMNEHDDNEHDHEDGEWACDSCGGPMYQQAHWNYAQCDDCGARQELIDDDYL
jgi:Zn finger protein HypA/HybF involved in hydrogenase expression